MRFHSLLVLLVAFLGGCRAPEAGAPAVVGPGIIQPVAKATRPERPVPRPADGFDYPVGSNAKGYYNAQGFQQNNHLGDDWNGVGGGNTDLGDPVYAIADGIVVYAEDAGPGWGNVVRVLHNTGSMEAPVLIESLYAHLDTMLVQAGDTLLRGIQLGTIGNADGAYYAHLHLELRRDVNLPIGGGYSSDTAGFLDPTAYIRAHRPKGRD